MISPGLAAAPEPGAALLARASQLVPAMQRRAAALDAACAFPEEDIGAMRDAGLLAAPLPRALGGHGAGTEAEGAALALGLLRACGQGNLAVARLFEAHVNALRLIMRDGSTAQRDRAGADAQAGRLFGLWVTDPPGDPPLRAERDVLRGRKGPCSGAGHCARAVVTAQTAFGASLAVIALDGTEPIVPVAGLQGMRAAANGTVTLDGVVADWIGAPGDYLREPDFSCGAWRSSAAASGALDALAAAVGAALARKGQAGAPMQQARFGELLIAQETARLWLARAAEIAEAADGDPARQVAYVNLCRIAVETACLDALRLAQRSLGLAAFVAPHPVERLARDLGTYLRQPAPDAVLLEAAAWRLEHAAC